MSFNPTELKQLAAKSNSGSFWFRRRYLQRPWVLEFIHFGNPGTFAK